MIRSTLKFIFSYVKCILKQDIFLFSNYLFFSVQWVHISKENYDINHGKDDITRREHILRDTIHCFCPNQKVGEILILTIFFNIFPDWLHLHHLPRFTFKIFLFISPYVPVFGCLSFLLFYFLTPTRLESVKVRDDNFTVAWRITLTKMTKKG